MLGTACALIAMQERAARREALLSEFRPYTGGQQLFTIEDFDSGRVSFPDAGMRGVNQVVKSNDENIGMPDHKWEHQTRVNEAPMQEWPMTTAGMKTKTSQLVSRQGLKRLSQVDQQELKAAKSLDNEGTQLLKDAGSIPQQFDTEDPKELEREIDDVGAQRAQIKRKEALMSAKERRLQIEYHNILQKQRRAGTIGIQGPAPRHMAQQPAVQPDVQEEVEQPQAVAQPLQAPQKAFAEPPQSFGRHEGGMMWSYPMGTNIAFIKTEDFPKVMEGSWHTAAETAQDQQLNAPYEQ